MVQYVKTCYGALVQQTSSSLDMESGFQMLPCGSSLLAATASSQQGTGGRLLVTAAAGAGPYCKVWTHPDDIEVLFPDGQSPGPLGSTRGERKHKIVIKRSTMPWNWQAGCCGWIPYMGVKLATGDAPCMVVHHMFLHPDLERCSAPRH